ncbi:MAG TPA: DUF4399 domain-containing protein [Chitinophagaceae bacterium]|nr:DUF4399 domain-containing protein [Chitinophagaceae bacterium]
MKLKYFLPVIALIVLTACNNSSESKEKKTDSTITNMSDDSMHHIPATTGNIPALPAIPEGANVFFKNIKNGADVNALLTVEMGVEKMIVDTAGPVVGGSGHHHLFIDAEDSLPAGVSVPKDASHMHFGRGETETGLKLSEGTHKLTLQFADGLHRSYGGRLSATITVNVK